MTNTCVLFDGGKRSKEKQIQCRKNYICYAIGKICMPDSLLNYLSHNVYLKVDMKPVCN